MVSGQLNLSTFARFLGYHVNMIVTEEISEKVQKLPRPSQEKVLRFVDLLLEKNGDASESQEWSDFSFAQAMRGLEDDGMYAYTDADLKERWQ